MNVRSAIVIFSAAMSSGCAAQIGGGADTTTTASTARDVWHVGVQLQNDRHFHSLASARLNVTSGPPDRPVQIKSAILGVGLRIPPRSPAPLGFGGEFALEGGAGAPTTARFDGFGAYAGFRGSLIYRLLGSDDVKEGYSIGYATLDLVPTLRGGTWGVPFDDDTKGDATLPELGAELAIRINFGSDLLSTRQPEEPR